MKKLLAGLLFITLAAFTIGCGSESTRSSSSFNVHTIKVHSIVGRWAESGTGGTTLLIIKARNDGTYRVVWKHTGWKDHSFAARMSGLDSYSVVGQPSVYLFLDGATRLAMKSGEDGIPFERLTSEKPADMALAAQQQADGLANGFGGVSSGASQPGLADRVAADLNVRTDYTSFDIPTPTVKVTGPAYGGGKIVDITYYVSGDNILNENALVDGVSPATVDVMAGAFSEPDVKIVDVKWKTDFTDAYGNSSKGAAMQIRWKRKTFRKVNVNGLFERTATSPEILYMISDWYSIHPAIWKATHLKREIPMMGGN